jgi:hypothetical protein
MNIRIKVVDSTLKTTISTVVLCHIKVTTAE